METAEDLISRDITPFMYPGSEMFKQLFAASSDPIYQEISRRLVIAKDYEEYEDMVRKVISTGLFADIGNGPWWINSIEELKYWYRSSETIAGDNPYVVHLTNKKWPLRKVLLGGPLHFSDQSQSPEFGFGGWGLGSRSRECTREMLKTMKDFYELFNYRNTISIF